MLGSAPLPDFVHRLHVETPSVRAVMRPASRHFRIANSLRWSRLLKLCFWLGVIMIVWCS